MKKSIFIAALTALSFSIPSVTLAEENAQQQPQAAPAATASHAMQMQTAQIPGADQLSPDKKAILDKMLKDLKTDMRAKMSLIHAKNAMLDAKLMQPTIDKKEIDGLVKEIVDMNTQMLQHRVDSVMKIKEATGINVPLFPKRHMMMQMHSGNMGMMDKKPADKPMTQQ